MTLASFAAAVRAVDRRVALRAALVVGAYLAAALVMLLTVMAVRAHVPPTRLRDLLAYFVFSNLAFGLDPGTAKSAALGSGGAEPRPIASYLMLSAGKGLVLAPILACIWRFSDPQAPLSALLWLPGMCVAGMCVGNMRVLLDLRGKHAAATGLKQGVLSLGHLIAGLCILAGLHLPAAIGAATTTQLSLTGVMAWRFKGWGDGALWANARAMLFNLRWIDFAGASAISSASGAADRILGLRLLPAADYNLYFLTYEGLMRFWLVPYLLTPILFARTVGGLPSVGLARGAWAVTALGGAAMIGALGLAMVSVPGLLAVVLGGRLPVSALLFAAGVVLLAMTQIRLTQLQAAGRSRRALGVIAVNGALAVVIFFVAARYLGLVGVMAAWAVRGALDLAIAMLGGRAEGSSQPRGVPSPGLSDQAA
jgi:hypothetical protein